MSRALPAPRRDAERGVCIAEQGYNGELPPGVMTKAFFDLYAEDGEDET